MTLAAIAGLAAYIILTGETGSARGNFQTYYVNPLARLPGFLLGMCAAEALPHFRRLRLPAASWTAVKALAVVALIAINACCQAGLPWLHLHAGAGWAAWISGEGSAPAAVVLIAVLARPPRYTGVLPPRSSRPTARSRCPRSEAAESSAQRESTDSTE